MGRATQGVRLINLKGNDSIASVAKVDSEELDEIEVLDEDGNVIPNAETTVETEGSAEDNSNGTDIDNASEDEKED